MPAKSVMATPTLALLCEPSSVSILLTAAVIASRRDIVMQTRRSEFDEP